MRLNTRGPETGVCNLCGQHGKLTVDHIPPKGVPRVGQSDMMVLVDFLRTDVPRKSTRHFQRGVTFRSICAVCNNVLLGQRYDPALIAFCRDIDKSLRDRIYLPMELDVALNRVARSVVGHLMAHSLGTFGLGELRQDLSRYFLDEAAIFPVRYCLYAWPFPYNEQVVIDAAAIVDMRADRQNHCFSLLKFYPMAFLVTEGALPASEWALTRLDPHLSGSLGDVVPLAFAVSGLPRRRWPEAPGKFAAVLTGDGAIAATRR